MYGDQVAVRYHDADDPAAAKDDLLQYVREERLPLPAVFLNGQLLYAGKLDPLLIAIDVATERERLLEASH
jgi:predicted thioredoxin/glutaredoxin